MANTSKKVAPVSKSTKSVKAEKITEKESAKKVNGIIQSATVKIGDESDVKTKKNSRKTQTTKSTKSKATVSDRVIPTVALRINKEFSGINLFFQSREAKTDKDSEFMKSDDMKMRWNRTAKYWFVRLRNPEQVTKIINHFGDRLDVPADIEKQVKEVLDAMPKTKETTKSKSTTTMNENWLADIPF